MAVDADDAFLAGLDAGAPPGVRGDQPGFQVAGRDGGRRAAHVLDAADLLPGVLGEFRRAPRDDVAALEEIGVLQQVGLLGEHLLHAQRPLLVPGPRQAERLVPGGQLNGAGAGVPGERDPQHLQHDPLHVVLRLCLGQAEGVDLHAVAEPARAGVGDAVAFAGDAVPDGGERPHLAHLLDEADARVDEEGDAADDRGEPFRRDAVRVARRVQDGDGGGQGEGDLLDRGRTGLLEVVAGDVDRVPPRHVRHGVRDGVRGQPERGAGREDVRAAGEVLLDDVVLRGAGQRRGVRALLGGGRAVERQQPHGGGVDGQGGVGAFQRDAAEQPPHVAEVGHRDADAADLAAGEDVVGVVAGLRRQVEGDGQAGLAPGEVAPVQVVGGFGAGVPRVGPHQPGPVPVRGHLTHPRRGRRRGRG